MAAIKRASAAGAMGVYIRARAARDARPTGTFPCGTFGYGSPGSGTWSGYGYDCYGYDQGSSGPLPGIEGPAEVYLVNVDPARASSRATAEGGHCLAAELTGLRRAVAYLRAALCAHHGSPAAQGVTIRQGRPADCSDNDTDPTDRGSAPAPVADLPYPPGIPRTASFAGWESAHAAAGPQAAPPRARRRRRRHRASSATEPGPVAAHAASLSCIVMDDPTVTLLVAESSLARAGLFLATGPSGASLRDSSGRGCALSRARGGSLSLNAQVCRSPKGTQFLGFGFPPGSGTAVDARLDTGAELSVLGPDHARALAVRPRASGRLVRGIGGPVRTIGSGCFDVVLFPGGGTHGGGRTSARRPAG